MDYKTLNGIKNKQNINQGYNRYRDVSDLPGFNIPTRITNSLNSEAKLIR